MGENMNKKPVIEDKIKDNWQEVIDLSAEILDVSPGIILQAHSDNQDVLYLMSNVNKLDYSKAIVKLLSNINHELVQSWRDAFLVSDSYKYINLNFSNYYIFPLKWPDGDILGFILLPDSKRYNTTIYKTIIEKIKNIFESDIETIFTNYNLKEENKRLNHIKNKISTLY